MTKIKDFITIRSFLAHNVEGILDNLNIRRKNKLNDTDDLFEISEDSNLQKTEMNWKLQFTPKSKFEILADEKNSLGLYVSGNPLQEYSKILEWVENVSYVDNLHLVLIEKIRKIFTKSGGMMLALEITTPTEQLEGLVFPKSALKFSAILQEKEVFWVLGKITRKEKKEEEAGDESEIKEYDQLPKLIIDQAVIFKKGPLTIISEAQIPITEKRKEMLSSADWYRLKKSPNDFDTKIPQKTEQNKASEITLKIPRSVAPANLAKIKAYLHKQEQQGYHLINIMVETMQGWRKSKTPLWLDTKDLNEVENLLK
jgi:DNA polymerase III alpha subunit